MIGKDKFLGNGIILSWNYLPQRVCHFKLRKSVALTKLKNLKHKYLIGGWIFSKSSRILEKTHNNSPEILCVGDMDYDLKKLVHSNFSNCHPVEGIFVVYSSFWPLWILLCINSRVKRSQWNFSLWVTLITWREHIISSVCYFKGQL